MTAGGDGFTTGGKMVKIITQTSDWKRTSYMPYVGTYVKQDTATSMNLPAPEMFESKDQACRCGRQYGIVHWLVILFDVEHHLCSSARCAARLWRRVMFAAAWDMQAGGGRVASCCLPPLAGNAIATALIACGRGLGAVP
jgi:hypothetical protein